MGRVVLVTGGNRGLGLAICEAFAAAGDTPVAACRSGAAPGGLSAVVCDVTDAGSVDAAFDAAEAAHGPVEVAVASAGIARDALLVGTGEDDLRAVVDTDLLGAVRVARRAARGMLRRRSGRIVLVSSVAGLSGSAGQTAYAAAKAGLVGLARSLVRELGPRGITVNVVAPGLLDTGLGGALGDARRAQVLAGVPLGRAGRAGEAAAVVRFLASADAGYVTGAVVPVDGGLGMGH